MVKAAGKQSDLWNSRQGSLIISILMLLATYLIASRAIETGSLQQYFLTFLFFGIAINRLIKAIKGLVKKD